MKYELICVESFLSFMEKKTVRHLKSSGTENFSLMINEVTKYIEGYCGETSFRILIINQPYTFLPFGKG